MGMDLTFVAGEGPRLAPPLADARIRDLQPQMERLEPIYETVRRVKAELAPETTFLGFAGSPWTVATYMIAGQGSREQAEARQLAYSDPGKMDAILDIVAEVTVDYLSRPDRGRGRRGAIVRQLGRKPVARPVRALGHRPTAWIVEQLQAAPSRHADHRLSQGRRRQASRLCRRNRGRCDRPRRDGRPGLGGARAAGRTCRSRAISTRWRWSPAARRCAARSMRILDALRRPPPHLQPGPWDPADDADRACRGAGRAGEGLGAAGMLSRISGLSRRGLSVGEGGARHLRHFLDRRACSSSRAITSIIRRRPRDRPRTAPGSSARTRRGRSS